MNQIIDTKATDKIKASTLLHDSKPGDGDIICNRIGDYVKHYKVIDGRWIGIPRQRYRSIRKKNPNQ